MNKMHPLKPIPFWISLLCLAAPTGVMFVAIYAGMPILNRAGVPVMVNSAINLLGPLMLLAIATLMACKLEGNDLSWPILKERLRLRPMGKREWLWAAGLWLFMIATSYALEPITRWLAAIPLFAPPEFLPSFLDPRVIKSPIASQFMGVPLQRSWWVIPGYLGAISINIAGEELWWRGYLLPRQELTHGQWTWVVHGILWDLFHVFWRWGLLGLLPSCLIMAFAAQRLKNTWPCIIAHFAYNASGMVPIVLGILASHP